MTILQALDGYYARMAARGEAEMPGWSREKFGWCVVIDGEGAVVAVQDLRDLTGKKPAPKFYEVPSGGKRTSGVAANFLWDKSAYSLGRTAGEGKRTAQEHADFVQKNLARIAGVEDPGLLAFGHFLKKWRPEQFDAAPFSPEMLDANILFRFAGDSCYLHERPAARALVMVAEESAGKVPGDHCLVTGVRGRSAVLHPTIKGVDGGQTSGSSLVSFNLDAFTSYGKEQGANAPTSEAAAFRYGAALNRLLTRGGPNRVSRAIGDATTIFWADASAATPGEADALDDWFGEAMEPKDSTEAAKVADELQAIAAGRPLPEINPSLSPGTRFHVLGLAPNAARLSVRFWISDTFEAFATRLAQHHADLAIEPKPAGWGGAPAVGRLLVRTTALGEKFENIPPLLAGEVMRAVLSGTDYPRTLLSAILMRLRAGDPGPDQAGRARDIGWHAAVLRAVLFRRQRRERRDPHIREEGEIPVALKRDHNSSGYQLGRLFAVYELAQIAALGRNVNATIRDKYFGGAAATPAGVFPLVITNGQNHLAKARKTNPGWAFLIERELEEIVGRFDPVFPHTLPRALRLEDQAEFAIGYYHQRAARLTSDKGDALSLSEAAADGAGDDTTEQGNDEE